MSEDTKPVRVSAFHHEALLSFVGKNGKIGRTVEEALEKDKRFLDILNRVKANNKKKPSGGGLR